MRVLALDPGERVGWARADVNDAGQWSELRHGITELRPMALSVRESLAGPTPNSPGYDLVICEEWRLYPHKAQEMIGSSFPSVQFIGMVQLCCWTSGVKLKKQGAGVMTTGDKWMRRLNPELHEMVNAPRAHDDAHDMSAIRHLFYWTVRSHKLIPATEGVTA